MHLLLRRGSRRVENGARSIQMSTGMHAKMRPIVVELGRFTRDAPLLSLCRTRGRGKLPGQDARRWPAVPRPRRLQERWQEGAFGCLDYPGTPDGLLKKNLGTRTIL